jgi:hypothetical protein
MSDTTELIKSVVTGLLAGGASAGTTFFATQGNLRRRLEAVEAQLGSSDDKKTGMHLAISNIEELVKRLRKDLDEFEDSPPAWVTRLMSRTRTQSGLNLEIVETLEDKIRTNAERQKRFEDGADTRYISRAEYDNDDRERAKEVAKLREELLATNGLLRGVVAMLGVELPETKRLPRG